MKDRLTLLREFCWDAVVFAKMIASDSMAAHVHGTELQIEMRRKYPRHWMTKLYREAGRFNEAEHWRYERERKKA